MGEQRLHGYVDERRVGSPHLRHCRLWPSFPRCRHRPWHVRFSLPLSRLCKSHPIVLSYVHATLIETKKKKPIKDMPLIACGLLVLFLIGIMLAMTVYESHFLLHVPNIRALLDRILYIILALNGVLDGTPAADVILGEALTLLSASFILLPRSPLLFSLSCPPCSSSRSVRSLCFAGQRSTTLP